MIQALLTRRSPALILAVGVATLVLPATAFAKPTAPFVQPNIAVAASAQAKQGQGLGTPDDPNCSIQGTAGDDTIIGTPGRDVICAGLGDDLVLSKGGNDVILGQGGDDRIRGGPGADKVDGARGDDTIKGGKGPDKLYGAWGRDAIKGGPGKDVIESKPMPNIVPWKATLSASFDFPAGSRFDIRYVPQSGKCLGGVPPSYEITSNDPATLPMFVTSVPWPWDSCFSDPSSAVWDLVLYPPKSSAEIQRGQLVLTSGPPGPLIHSVFARCTFQGVECRVIGGVSADLNVIVPAVFGPVAGPTPPPSPPSLNCQPNFHVQVGVPLNETNGHVCTVEGYPLATVTVTGLPDSLTLRRWPTPEDSWLVLQGVPKDRSITSYNVSVTAELPGWFTVGTFRLFVQ